MEILVATRNSGKIREFQELLANSRVRFRGLEEFDNVAEVEETGATFAENARLKAREYALATGQWTLADDSGLRVAALGGAPGVFSARYGGAGLSDAQRTGKLLGELEKTRDSERKAEFVCVIAFANPNGEIIHTATGVSAGRIAANVAGSNGFGYDPVFVPDGFDRTFGELPPQIKREISHRARAMREIMRFLQDFSPFSLDPDPQHG